MSLSLSGNSNDENLIIQFPKEKFGEFIIGLLGKKQKLSRVLRGTLTLKLEDILDVHYRIEKRIKDQAVAENVQFSIKISYYDGLSVELNSLEELTSYAESKPLVVSSVFITWVYLVTFPSKDVPERQQIELEFSTKSMYYSYQANLHSPETKEARINRILISSEKSFDNYTGKINYEIQHSSRTWGIDIENLLHDFALGSLVDKDTWTKRLIRNYSVSFTAVMFTAFIFIFSGIGSVFLHNHYLFEIAQANRSILQSNDKIAVISSKISILIGFVINTDHVFLTVSVLLYSIVSCILAGVAAGLFGSVIKEREPSFILLTKSSINDMKITMEKYNRRWRNATASIIIAVLTGVIGNVIFALTWTN